MNQLNPIITSECALCGRFESLRDSHILPEFVYRPSYDASHTAIELDTRKGRRGKRQKGFSERLFCAACEARFNRWETYFANVWLNPAKTRRPNLLISDLIQISGLDYEQFKLFHLSVVWRAGISKHPMFDNVRLGTQAQKLRFNLLESNPGTPRDYPFFGIALREPKAQVFQDGMILGPEASRVSGHWVYTFIFGGVQWHYYGSGHHTDRNIPVIFGYDGVLVLAVKDWTEINSIRHFASQLPRRR
jgi:hypothetical protein